MFNPYLGDERVKEYLEYVTKYGKPTEETSVEDKQTYDKLFYAAFVDPYIGAAYEVADGGFGHTNTIAESETKVEGLQDEIDLLPTKTDFENAQKKVTE
jgi:hypothetical protein